MLLALDTASRQASVALYDEQGVRAETSWYSHDNQTVELMPRVTEMLAQQGVEPAALRGVAVAIGPGSFTGLRIALSVAKGLAVGRGIPVLGIPTLDALAQALVGQRMPLRAILSIGRGRYAITDYRVGRDQWHRTSKDRLATPAEVVAGIRERTLFAGEIDAALRQLIESTLDSAAVLLPAAAHLRRAGYLAELGWQRLVRGDRDDPATLAPIYLHSRSAVEAAAVEPQECA
jgi:tRNA threonylcarbamoyladenosine biosynthesis protein TsaB